MSNESDSPGTFLRPLRLAKWCALIPFVLGVGSTAAWLLVGGRLEDVGPFFIVGVLAIGLGLLLLPVGIVAAVVASRRGAPSRAVAFRITALIANLAVAVVCWKTGTFLADLQIVRITNKSSEVIGPIRVWIEPELAPSHAFEIERLEAGESRTWVLHYSNEGVATFRWVHGARTIEPNEIEGVFLGIGQPMEVQLELSEQGKYKLDGVFARRWSWLTALRH